LQVFEEIFNQKFLQKHQKEKEFCKDPNQKLEPPGIAKKIIFSSARK
jgi:hypothetical protein